MAALRYAAGLLAITLGGCVVDQSVDDLDPPLPDDTTAAVADSPWSLRISAGGASLSLPPDETGAIPFRIACVRDPVILSVESETTAPIGSEERFSFGIDGEPYVFVADVTGTQARGVYAERPVDDEILGRLEGAREFGAVYGATSFGPYPAPSESDLTSFIAACRLPPDPKPVASRTPRVPLARGGLPAAVTMSNFHLFVRSGARTDHAVGPREEPGAPRPDSYVAPAVQLIANAVRFSFPP